MGQKALYPQKSLQKFIADNLAKKAKYKKYNSSAVRKWSYNAEIKKIIAKETEKLIIKENGKETRSNSEN